MTKSQIKPTEKRRDYCFVIFNWDHDLEERLQNVHCKYLIYGYEICPTTGSHHLQGYIYLHNARSMSGLQKEFGMSCVPPKGAPEQQFDYCSKDGQFFTKGVIPMSDKAKGETEKARWATIIKLSTSGDFTTLRSDYPSEYVRYQNSLKRMHREDAPPPEDLPYQEKYGVWIYGPPRTGKSHKARHDYGVVYLKDINKWWDEYHGEDNVLIDELCPTHAPFMTGFLKKWVDRWKFSAEVKGGRILARPKKIIVTSNYSIEECFPEGVDRDALKSRFEIIHMPFPYKPT